VSRTDGIAAALRPLASPFVRFGTARLAEGPSAVASRRDRFAAAGTLRETVPREEASAHVVACASNPGLDAARAATVRPVLGTMDRAVAAALARAAERFGTVGFTDTSLPRQRRVLQATGVEGKLYGRQPLNVPVGNPDRRPVPASPPQRAPWPRKGRGRGRRAGGGRAAGATAPLAVPGAGEGLTAVG
jgi:Asp/Glu/hydantoin racemase